MFARAAARRSYWLCKPPPGEYVMFPRSQETQFVLPHLHYFSLIAVASAGFYLGRTMWMGGLMSANPANPPRDPDEARPKRHLHSVPEDDE